MVPTLPPLISSTPLQRDTLRSGQISSKRVDVAPPAAAKRSDDSALTCRPSLAAQERPAAATNPLELYSSAEGKLTSSKLRRSSPPRVERYFIAWWCMVREAVVE